jgi:hypothetical protein
MEHLNRVPSKIIHEIDLNETKRFSFYHKFSFDPLLGCNCAIAAMRFRSTIGGSSIFCSQPTGGLTGGEIRKSFSGSGGRKYVSGFAPRKTMG